jgi:hypothetical protein
MQNDGRGFARCVLPFQGPCGCLVSIAGTLWDEWGKTARMKLAPYTDTKTGESGLMIPPLEVSWREGKKRVSTVLEFRYCPYCGRSYRGRKQTQPTTNGHQ